MVVNVSPAHSMIPFLSKGDHYEVLLGGIISEPHHTGQLSASFNVPFLGPGLKSVVASQGLLDGTASDMIMGVRQLWMTWMVYAWN